MASQELNFILISIVGIAILGVIFFLLFFKRKTTNIASLEMLLNEKESNLIHQKKLQNLEKEYKEQIESARNTLNREIFELQKDLFEKFSEKK